MRRATAILIGGIVIAGAFFGIGESWRPRGAQPTPSPAITESVHPPATQTPMTGSPRKPHPLWATLEDGSPRAAIVYNTSLRRRRLAVIGPSGRARLCAEGSDRMRVGDFANGTILFLDEGNLYSVSAACKRAPTLLVRSSDLAEPDQRDQDDGSIACPSLAPDGVHYVLSTYGSPPKGPALWKGLLSGGSPIALGPVPACGWLDGRHVLAMTGDLVDTFAITIDGSGRSSLLREPWWWHGSLTPDGTRSVYRLNGMVIVGSSRYERPTAIEPSFWECVDGSTSGNGTGGGMAHHLGVLRGSRWDPSGERFLLSSDGAASDRDRTRVWILGAGGRPIDTVQIPWCETVGWFGPRRLLVVDHKNVGVPQIFELATRRYRTVRLPGSNPSRNWDSAPPFLIERPLVAPNPSDPFLGPGTMRTEEIAGLGIALDLPPSWHQQRCRERLCSIGPYPVSRRIEGWQEHWGAHTTGVPLELAKSRDDPDRARERLLEPWDTRPSCRDDDECARVQVDRTVMIDGREFQLLEIQFYEWFRTWMIGPMGDGSLVMEMPGRFYRMDLTIRQIIKSLRFLSE